MKKQWQADISVSADLAQTLIEGQFPQQAPVNIKVLGEGWDNTVFRVNDSYVFRFPRRQVAVVCIEAENRVLPKLSSQLPVPVPNPTLIGRPSSLYPYPFSGYTILPGRTPYSMNLSETDRIKSAVSFAEFLKALHHVPIDDAVEMGARDDTMGRMDIPLRVKKFHEYLTEAVRRGLLSDIRPLEQIIDSLPVGENPSQTSALVHGDLNFRNFLVDTDGALSGVIDWGDVHIGHPAVDLAIAHSFLPPQGRHIFREVYGEIDDATWQLAKFRALYTNLFILVYAHDIGDEAQLREAASAIQFALMD